MSALPMPEVPGVTHSWHEARGIRFHVAEAGQGPPLVMLHGWPQHWWMWSEVIAPLARDHRVLCPDLRGFGWSDAPPGPYDKQTLADDILALLDVLGVERFGLVGHDWGGWCGFLMCLAEPERVERFVAVCIPPPFGGASLRGALEAWRLAYQVPLSAPLVGRHVVQALPRLLARERSRPRGWSEDDARIYLAQFEERDRAEASVHLYRTFATRELATLAAGRLRGTRLHTPTLLVQGLLDPVVRPAFFSGYESHADDMRVELVEDRGHFIVDEDPGLVADRLRAFLA